MCVGILHQQTKLLLRKNWILKKRRAKSLLGEIFIPVAVIGLILLFRSLIEPEVLAELHPIDAAVDTTSGIDQLFNNALCGISYSSFPKQVIAVTARHDGLSNEVASLAQFIRNEMIDHYPPMTRRSCAGIDVDVRQHINNSLVQIFPSESDLLAHIGHSDYRDEDFPHHVFSSVVLTKSGAADHKWAYEIRSNSSDVPTTLQKMDMLEVGFARDRWQEYWSSGALTLQFLVDQYIVHKETGTSMGPVQFVPMPVPAHKHDPFAANMVLPATLPALTALPHFRA